MNKIKKTAAMLPYSTPDTAEIFVACSHCIAASGNTVKVVDMELADIYDEDF